ncbi:MAG: hypothetical protein U9R72_12790 [Chloroflexota bacterium]|nr:hypothetical protein [Chloroflexota bacterium]
MRWIAQGGSPPAYELILDRSTLAVWLAQFSAVASVFLLSVGGLWLPLFERKSRGLAVAAGLLCVGSIAAIAFHTTLSPFAYHRRRLEPAIMVGEELFRRYADYRSQHGGYPASIDVVYSPALDRLDRVDGVRQGFPACDPYGVGCRPIGVKTAGQLVVEVHEELIQCDITNLSREWTCRDHR